jgi:intracellular septation protein
MKTPPPKWFKPAVDYGPIAVFFIAYKTSGLMTATLALMVATLIAVGAAYALTRRLPLMPMVTLAIVGVFGGLTLWFKDDTFIKMKPTIIQGLFAVALGGGLLFGRPLLKDVMEGGLSMDDAGWRKLTLRMAWFFAAMAGLNELVWRTQSTDLWVDFKVFGIMGLTFVFMLMQAGLIRRHQAPAETETGDSQLL